MEKHVKAIGFRILTVAVFLLIAGCFQPKKPFVTNHRNFHENHVLFLSGQRRVVSGLFDQLTLRLEESQEQVLILAHWELILRQLEELGDKNEVYTENCLVLDRTLSMITGMTTARGEIVSTVLTEQTDVESAVKRGDYATATRIVRELRQVILEQTDTLLSHAEAYLEVVDESAQY